MPWAGAKLALIAALAAVASGRLGGGFSASRSAVQRALVVVAWAAVIVSPLWLIPRSASSRLLALLAAAATAFSWSRLGEGIRIRPGRDAVAWAPWLVCLVLLAWHGPGLFAPLEFRGDEDFHVARPLRVLEALANPASEHKALLAVLLIIGLLGLAVSATARRAAVWAFVVVVPLALLGSFVWAPLEAELLARLARYPVLGAWLSLIAAFSPLDALGVFRTAPYQEALYRLVPFASALALALFVLRVVKGPPWLRSGAAILVGGAPSVGYFATSLYPDLTAVVFVTAAVLAIDTALRRGLSGRSDFTGAKPTLAIGLLLKETLLPSGLAVAAWALGRAAVSRRFHRALRFAFALLAPIGLYIVFRTSAQELLQGGRVFRGVFFDLSALTSPAFYTILLRALAEQLGPLLPLATLGALLSWRRSRTRLLGLVLLSQLLLFAMDTVVDTPWGRLPLFWGHARFLLTLLPVAVCWTIDALGWLGRRPRLVAAAALAAGIAWNAGARPVAFDGSRSPFWGDYVGETSGERYPYDALYEWLARAGERGPLTIVGRDYRYRDDFYLKKYGLDLGVGAPRAEVPRSSLVLAGAPDRAALLRAHAALLESSLNAPGPVVLHVSAWLDADELPRDVGALHAVRNFRLGRHALILYSR